MGTWHCGMSPSFVQAWFERLDGSLKETVNGFLRGMMQICADTQTEAKVVVCLEIGRCHVELLREV